MRKIAVIIGSVNDLPQCLKGLNLLKEAENKGEIEVCLYVSSIHRNHDETITLVKSLQASGINFIITGAGCANHLTGIVDSYLRYELRDDKIIVIGVAFEDEEDAENTRAAILSMTRVPKTQVIFKEKNLMFIGSGGFYSACRLATTCSQTQKITLPEKKSTFIFSLDDALFKATEIALRQK